MVPDPCGLGSRLLLLAVVELHTTKEAMALLVTDIVYRHAWLLSNALPLIFFYYAEHLVYVIM